MAYKPFQMPVDVYEYLVALRDQRRTQQHTDRVSLNSVLREQLGLPDPKAVEAGEVQPQAVRA